MEEKPYDIMNSRTGDLHGEAIVVLVDDPYGNLYFNSHILQRTSVPVDLWVIGMASRNSLYHLDHPRFANCPIKPVTKQCSTSPCHPVMQ